MEIKQENGILYLNGVFTEDFARDEVERAIKNVPLNKKGLIPINFKKIHYANSCGILEWLRLVHSLEEGVSYIACPMWLQEQFNYIRDFFTVPMDIESIIIPLFSEDVDEINNKLLVIGKDVPLLETYTDFSLEYIDSQGQLWEADIFESEHFRFLQRMKELQKIQEKTT